MGHRVVVATGGVEQVGEVVLDRTLEVPVTDRPAELDRCEAVAETRLHITSSSLGQCESGQGRDPRSRILTRRRHRLSGGEPSGIRIA